MHSSSLRGLCALFLSTRSCTSFGLSVSRWPVLQSAGVRLLDIDALAQEHGDAVDRNGPNLVFSLEQESTRSALRSVLSKVRSRPAGDTCKRGVAAPPLSECEDGAICLLPAHAPCAVWSFLLEPWHLQSLLSSARARWTS